MAPGLMSEEPAESQNKYIRFFRAHHARRISLKANLTDVFMRATLQSSPRILTLLSAPILSKRCTKPLPKEVQNLLLNRSASVESDESEESDLETL